MAYCWRLIKRYMRNCSIHGVRYLVDEQLSTVERLFWLIACCLCWWGCTTMIISVVKEFNENPLAVTVETLHLNWQTPFPAIGFCIVSTASMRNRYFKLNPGLSNYSYAAASEATTEELLQAYEEIKVPCESFIVGCQWNNVRFNCCAELRPIYKTGNGHCLLMNSYHPIGSAAIKFYLNRTVKYGDLVVDILDDKSTKSFFPRAFQVYVLNNYQVPGVFSNGESQKLNFKAGKTTKVEIKLKDLYNENGVQHILIGRRSCRFPDEIPPGSYFPSYSNSLCKLEDIARQMIKNCGCVQFYYEAPPGAKVCNMSELRCILTNKADILRQSAHQRICLPDCEGAALTVTPSDMSGNVATNKKHARIHFTTLAHPIFRYRRYVVRTELDVVGLVVVHVSVAEVVATMRQPIDLGGLRSSCVSVGSALGLFMGASILTLLELPYWLLLRRP